MSSKTSTKRAIKRKIDESVLKKARSALGLPLESQDDKEESTEPSLKWRKPRHNTSEGQTYVKNKQKRMKEEQEAQGQELKKAASTSTKKDDKKGKKKNRKKKKAKLLKTESTPQSKDPDGEKRHGMEALSYLQLWSSNRDHWKFEKRKQTWLLKNCLRGDLVDGKRFEILVEYIGSMKGAARKTTLEEMQSIVKKDEISESKNDDSTLESSKDSSDIYDRARQIIQILVDDE